MPALRRRYHLGFDLFGMTGLVFVQTITYFSVAYLILRGMLERCNPALDEAAENLGASKFHVFRTVTLPMLIPGLAGSFLLLFVESLADLGNPQRGRARRHERCGSLLRAPHRASIRGHWRYVRGGRAGVQDRRGRGYSAGSGIALGAG
jgi:hypothetical protein